MSIDALYQGIILAQMVLVVVILLAWLISARRKRGLAQAFKDLNSLHSTLVTRHYDLLRRAPRVPDEDDANVLEKYGREYVDALESELGEPNEIALATMPVPVIEVIYEDCIISLHMSIEHLEPEEESDEEHAALVLEPASN